MTTPKLADKDSCTGCGACAAACPIGCIALEPDSMGVRTPSIDGDACIGCGACERACHLLSEGVLHAKSDDVFAAWQTDADDRRASASGGVASACYRWGLSKGIHCYGVPADDLYAFRFIELSGESDIQRCKNSKYAESDVSGVFESAKKQLRKGEGVLFIGLPCQVAALRTFVGEKLEDGLTTVDIICHGVCPSSYLEEHVKRIEGRCGRTASALSFRDPAFVTSKFRLTLSDTQGLFYKKGPKSNDGYQVGYHSALTYRENCYSCRYARRQRAGDLTIGDFSGYGRHGQKSGKAEKVSCAIASTPRGARLLAGLTEFGIETERRDPDEAFLYERQLKEPSVRHPGRSAFLEAYGSGLGFDRAVGAAMGRILLRNGIVETLRLREAELFARSLVPKSVKRAIRKCIRRS